MLRGRTMGARQLRGDAFLTELGSLPSQGSNPPLHHPNSVPVDREDSGSSGWYWGGTQRRDRDRTMGVGRQGRDRAAKTLRMLLSSYSIFIEGVTFRPLPKQLGLAFQEEKKGSHLF